MAKNLNPNKITKYFKDQTPPNVSQLELENKKFTDDYFPPTYNTLISKDSKGKYIDKFRGEENRIGFESECKKSKEYIWKRISEIEAKELKDRKNEKDLTWEILEGSIAQNDIIQGELGDCYFLASISALAQYPYLIREKFRTTHYSKVGFYEVIFFIDGEWQVVFIDDYFPYDQRSKSFAFSKPHGKTIWPMILEKAWAKINGGFSNIVAGIVNDPISALTGYPTDYIKHEEIESDDLFSKIRDSSTEGFIMSSSTKPEQFVEDNGLVPGHAYTLIQGKQYKSKDIYLIQLRNPWGENNWKGDWGSKSKKWKDEYKKYFNFTNDDNGIFWMNIEDYIDNYEATFICHILYGSTIKYYYFDYERYFKSPLVFDIKIKEKSKVSITLFFKRWRFNRDIENFTHPVSLVLCSYDKNNKIDNLYCNWSCDEDLSLIQELDKGNYVLWLYVDYANVNDKNFKYCLSVLSLKEYKVEYIGADNNFTLISELICENYRVVGAANLDASKDYFMGNNNKLSKGGLSNMLIYNKTDKWMEVKAAVDKIKNNKLLPPFEGKKGMAILIPPHEQTVILAMRITNEATQYNFNFNISFKKRKDPIPPKSQVFDIFLKQEISENNESGLRSEKFLYVTRNILNSLPHFDENNFFSGLQNLKKEEEIHYNEEMLSKEYPEEMKILLSKYTEEFPVDKNNKAIQKKWNKVSSSENKDDVYIGQTDDKNIFNGRGIFIWGKKKNKYIGYWNKGKMDYKGELVGKNNQVIYEGGYENGKRKGQGRLYITENIEYCEGNFDNDFLEGMGKYVFKNGDCWTGNFTHNLKNGVGYTEIKALGRKIIVEYDNDHFIYKIDIIKGISEMTNNKENNQRKKNFWKDLKEQLIRRRATTEQSNTESNNDKEDKEDKEDEANEEGTISTKKPQLFVGGGGNKIICLEFFQKFMQDCIDKAGDYFKSNIQVQDIDSPVEESEEIKKIRKFDENILSLKAKEPFMLKQVMQLPSKESYKIMEYIEYEEDGKKLKYVGEVDESKRRHGRGCLFGGLEYYCGVFDEDYPTGIFRIFTAEKNILFVGPINEDYTIGDKGAIYFSSGEVYKGCLNENKEFHGYGTYFFKDGTSWSGNFINGNFDGFGKCLYNDGFISESLRYENRQIADNKDLNREDFTSKNSEEFFKNIKKKYPGIGEKILLIPPYRYTSETLEWVIKTLNNNDLYIGQMNKDGVLVGKGCFIYFSGLARYYIGYIEGNQRSRFGTLYTEQWDILYEGLFKKNKKEGRGREYYSDGTYYHGDFANDKLNGFGVFYFKNGSKYEGNFKDGERHGKGFLVDENRKTKQKIEYDNGNIRHQGEIIRGDLLRNKENEAKIMERLFEKYKERAKKFAELPPTRESNILHNSTKEDVDGIYVGEINSNGFKHGRGVLIKPNSTEFFVGYFVDDVKEGEGAIYYDIDEPKYIGNFRNDKKCGKGKYFNRKDKSVIEGFFDEAGEGDGTCTLENGNYWKGHFYGLFLHGVALYYNKDRKLLGKKTFYYNRIAKNRK